MKLSMHGTDILEVEVVQIDRHGIWLNVKDTEYFLSYKEYPWFKDAKVSALLNIELLHENHLHWPDLDVDLTTEMLSDPQKYTLIYQ